MKLFYLKFLGKESVKYIRENLTIPINEINRESIVNAAKVSLLV